MATVTRKQLEAIMNVKIRRKCWDEGEWFIPQGAILNGESLSAMCGEDQDGIELTICFPGLIWDFIEVNDV